MEKIVRIVLPVVLGLLTAAGCSKKGPDCRAAVDKGVDGYIAVVKRFAANSPRLDVAKIAGQLKAAMTQRCNEDKWQPDVVTCIGSVTGPDAMKGCEDKLTLDQKAKLDAQVRSVMMDAVGAGGSHMPPGVDGHPAALGGAANGSAATSGDSAAGAPAAGAPAAAAPADPPAAPKAGGW